MMRPYSSSASTAAVQCQSTLFLILGLPSLIATVFSENSYVAVFDLLGGALLTTIGVLGLVATKNSRYASWFLTGLYIYGALLSIIYAYCLFAVLLLTIVFPTCDSHSSGSCKHEQGITIAVMVLFMIYDVILFGLLTLVTYAIRDGRRLSS